ncbi:MAG: hypothetical protein U1F43_06350 [Myxococcota bacterium]
MSPAFPRALRIFLLLSGGALVVLSLRPLLEAVAGPGVPVMWWAARATGLLAVVALWLSVVFGVFMAGRGAGGLLPKPAVALLHARWAVAAQVATALHALCVVADPMSGVTPLAVALPLASATLTGPVALGTLALWGVVVLLVTTALARRLSKTVWRASHASAFGTFLLATVHGASAGSDAATPAVRGLFVITSALLVAAIVQRLLLARRTARLTLDPGDRS